MKKTYILTLLLFNCFYNNLYSSQNSNRDDYYNKNELRYDNYVYKEEIKTVKLAPESDPLAEPLIRLNSIDKLKLNFDEIGSDPRNYMYTFIHCDMAWKPSNIIQMDYMDGFFDNYIVDFEYSFNTIEKYVHYNLIFPNENIKLLISGNYIIKVFDENEADIPVITYRFMIFNPLAEISANITRASLIENRNYKQRIDYNVDLKSVKTPNPQSEVKTVVLQNGRWDNMIFDLKPLFIDKTTLKYNYDDDSNAFWAGNEFRFFDTRSFRYRSERVSNITFEEGKNNVYLFDDERRKSNNYVTVRDINGKFRINNREGTNHETDADYGYVHFSYKTNFPFVDEDLYVFGALSNWSFNPRNKMKYNEKKQVYEATLYLKQGFYNYEYVLLSAGDKTSSSFSTEGSHFETENDYLILVYLKQPGVFYDQLIGVKKMNSLNPIN